VCVYLSYHTTHTTTADSSSYPSDVSVFFAGAPASCARARGRARALRIYYIYVCICICIYAYVYICMYIYINKMVLRLSFGGAPTGGACARSRDGALRIYMITTTGGLVRRTFLCVSLKSYNSHHNSSFLFLPSSDVSVFFADAPAVGSRARGRAGLYTANILCIYMYVCMYLSG